MPNRSTAADRRRRSAAASGARGSLLVQRRERRGDDLLATLHFDHVRLAVEVALVVERDVHQHPRLVLREELAVLQRLREQFRQEFIAERNAEEAK